jgi:hypothetical protein
MFLIAVMSPSRGFTQLESEELQSYPDRRFGDSQLLCERAVWQILPVLPDRERPVLPIQHAQSLPMVQRFERIHTIFTLSFQK